MLRPRRHRCTDFCPPTWDRPWRAWHRGHGCELDPADQPPVPDYRPAIGQLLRVVSFQLKALRQPTFYIGPEGTLLKRRWWEAADRRQGMAETRSLIGAIRVLKAAQSKAGGL